MITALALANTSITSCNYHYFVGRTLKIYSLNNLFCLFVLALTPWQVAFSQSFGATFFAFLCIFSVTFLFEMVPKHSTKALSSAFELNKALVCLGEKMYVR